MDLNLTLDRHSPQPLYRQLYNRLRDLIQSGALPAGSRLPPERRLAANLGVNRSTVINAYHELEADALVRSRVGSGTVVQASAIGSGATTSLPWWQIMVGVPAEAGEDLLEELALLAAREGIISFARGAPDQALFPVEGFRLAVDAVLRRHGPEALEDAPAEGNRGLREIIAGRLAGAGIASTADDVLIIGGSHEGLYLLSRVLVESGDAVVVEAPTYLGALRVFRAAGARLLAVPVDDNGMRVDLLESLLMRQRPKLIYTLPTFHNPTGVTLAGERRRQLLALAARYQVAVVEDDPYRSLRYEGEDLPSLKALDKNAGVAYLGTFSKILSPGLRLGWLVAPQPLLARVARLKQVVDLHTASLTQWAVAEFCREGRLEPHIDVLRDEYRRRRDTMAAALTRHWPAEASWTVPAGGFYIWAELPAGVGARALLAETARQGVAFLPGGVLFVDGQGTNTVRLNFSSSPPEAIEEGIARMGRAINRLRGKREGHGPAGPRPSPRTIV